MKRKNTAESAVAQLYKALEMPFSSGYLSKTALSKMCAEVGLRGVKGDYIVLATRLLRKLKVAFNSHDLAKNRINSRTTQALIYAFLEWKKNENTEEKPQEDEVITYRNCSRMSLKRSMWALLGSEISTSMGTRASDFLLGGPVLLSMAKSMGLKDLNGKTNRGWVIALLKELGEEHSDVPMGGRAPVHIAERLVVAFLTNADGFIEGASEKLSKVKLEPRYIHPEKKVERQEEKMKQPTVEDEEFTVELGGVNLLNFMKGGVFANLTKAFKSCSEIGEVTKCDLEEGGKKIIIEIKLGGE